MIPSFPGKAFLIKLSFSFCSHKISRFFPATDTSLLIQTIALRSRVGKRGMAVRKPSLPLLVSIPNEVQKGRGIVHQGKGDPTELKKVSETVEGK